MKIDLSQHRKNLKDNSDRYTEDMERAINSCAEIMYKSHGNCGSKKKELMPFLKNLSKLIFEAQGMKSLYEYEDDGGVRSWNSPMNGGFNKNYIKWEIGHLISQNQGGTNNAENLSFQSARCNQHIQSGLNYNETTEYKFIPEVKERIEKLFKLHTSKEWLDLIQKINDIKSS